MKGKILKWIVSCFAGFSLLCGCTTAAVEEKEEEAAEMYNAAEDLCMYIGDIPVEVIWENNEAVRELYTAVRTGPLSVNLSMYGGFEQVGALGFGLPHDDERITTMPGDIVLYQGDQIVVFYGSNTWEYTKLGDIPDRNAEELKQLFGNGDVTIVLYTEEEGS